MAGFDSHWVVLDREGHVGVLATGKQGAITRHGGVDFGDPGIEDALYRAWLRRVMPTLAATRDHLAASSGGSYAVVFRDRASAAKLLGGCAFSWLEGGPTDGALALVEDVPEELANRIVADEAYRGAISTDLLAFNEERESSLHEYLHDWRPPASPYRYARSRLPEVALRVDDVPPDVARQFAQLPASFAEAETLDLEALLGANGCIEPPSAAPPIKRSWWDRFLENL